MAARITAKLAAEKYDRQGTDEDVKRLVAAEVETVMTRVAKPLEVTAFPRPHTSLVVGVNGSGKTTTIAKLAHRFQQQGQRVLLGAADTYRAAAADQLEIWAQRNGAEIVRQHTDSADPAAVAFDAVSAGVGRGVDVVLVDTAGRLHLTPPKLSA